MIFLATGKHYHQEFLMIDGYDYYLGEMPRNNFRYVVYNPKTKRLKISNTQSKDKPKTKEIKFNDNNEITEVFMGDFDGNLYNGHGIMLTVHDLYEGGFRDGLRDGFGKMSSPAQTYIGTFSEGLFHGEGHLIISTENTIYVGMFK